MMYIIFIYLLGLALILEGVMSSFYHICPTNANFQFGTVDITPNMIVCYI